MTRRRECTKAEMRIATLFAVALAITLSLAVEAEAADISETAYRLGESVIIHATPGAVALSIRSGDQVYRFLGEPPDTTAFQPSTIGEYTIQETLADGAVIETRFAVGSTPATIDMTVENATTQEPSVSAGPTTPTTGAIETTVSRPEEEVDGLEPDERPLSAINPAIRVRTGHGTGIAADFTIRPVTGGAIRGNTADLGGRLPGGVADVSFDFPRRHATAITLRGVDLSRGIDLGVDDVPEGLVDVPVPQRRWSAVYAIDPTLVSFTDGEVQAFATGTELYKCAAWDFTGRTCDGLWEKIMDLVPGEEYAVPLSPADPGFAEAVVTVGFGGKVSSSAISVDGSVPSPVETAANEWAAVVFNPTNRTIEVTGITFAASANMFGGVAGISPSAGWSSTANRLSWAGSLVLGPEDAAEFIAGVSGANANLLNIVVEVNATTNDTNVSADGYMTYTIANSNIQYPSVYFHNGSGASYSAKNISPDEARTFVVTVDNDAGTTAISIGTSLVIYIPPEWRNVSAGAQAGWSVGTVMGDGGGGWLLVPQVASTTIAAGGKRNFTFSATPPDRDGIELYRSYGILLGPSSNAGRIISTTFVPALRTLNLTTRLLDADDDRYAVTWTRGGTRALDQYLSVPAPTDNAVGGNMWGVTVVNPSNDEVNVTQVDFGSSINMFSSATGDHPSSGWSVPTQSTVRWTGIVTVPPRGARDFAVNITPLGTANAVGTITVTSVTSAGTLSSAGLVSYTRNGNIQYPAIIGVNASGLTFSFDGLPAGTASEFRLRISNEGAATAIPTSTALEIYIPPRWTNITAPTQAGWTVLHVRSDPHGGGVVRAIVAGSTIAAGASRDFVFNATAPTPGTNSTYRFDAWMIGETSSIASQIIQSTTQFAATVVPAMTGIDLTHLSEPLPSVINISAIAISDIVRASQNTLFNLSVLNTVTGAFDTLSSGTLGTAEEDWNATWRINRTFDPRAYANGSTGTVTIRWTTASANATALYEDYLTINATYDTILPTVTHTDPADDAFLNESTVTLTYNASDDNDLRNCTLLVNGTANQTDPNPLNGTPDTFALQVVDGAYSWDVRCLDLNGHDNETGNRTFTVDTIYPGVNLTSPANNTKYTMSAVTFTTYPDDANLANCTLVVDGAPNQTNTTLVSGQHVNFTVTLPEGNTTWTTECADLAGNVLRNASTRTVLVDTAPPPYAAIAAAPTSGEAYNASQAYAFSVNWTDVNGIYTVVFESDVTGAVENRTVNTSSGATYTYGFSTLAAGQYSWRMYANDTFGNVNATQPTIYIVTKAASNVTLYINDTPENYPADVDETVNITGILDVPAAGYLEIHVNGATYATGLSPLQNITSFATNGTRNVTIYYNETQNHSASNTTLRITVGDKLGPTINLTYPANASYASAVNVTFLFNISDATGVDNCTLFVNGTSNATKTAGLVNDAQNNITGGEFTEGSYGWFVRCVDPIGNARNSSTRQFGIDITPPTMFNLLSPPNGTVGHNQSPAFGWEASSDDHFMNYTLLIDNAADFSSPNYIYGASPESNTTIAITDTLASGTIWHWKVIAYDLAGNARESGSFTYTPDLDPPAITMQSPGNGTYINTTGINITYLISDVSVVANCTLSWNDTTTSTNTTLNQSGTNRFIETRTEGTHRFSISCTDIADNAGTGDEITITVDATPPLPVNLTSPPNGTFTNNNTPTLVWTQSEDANFANYTVIVSDNASFPYANHTYPISDIAAATYQVVSAWADGTWWWKVLAYDLAGNVADPGFTYTVDSTPPSAFDLTAPANNTASTNQSPTLTWEQSTDENFDNYTIIVSSFPDLSQANFTYARYGSANTTHPVQETWPDNTIWYWRVIAWDNATNSRNSTSTFRYVTDSQPPTLTLLAPANDTVLQTNSSLVAFTYNVTDLSGVASCTIAINDSASVLEDTDFFVEMDQNQTFTEALQTDSYNWSIRCTDLAGNNATSEWRALSVNVTLPRTAWYDSDSRSSPQENASANTTAIAVYASNTGAGLTTPRYRTWNGTAWSGETAMPSAGSNVQWVRVAANPLLGRADEQVAALVSADGSIDAYVWNGTDWAHFPDLGNVGTVRDAQRSFDIAFERQRGRAMLLYSVLSTNASRDLAYRIWNGSGWTPEAYVDDPSSGVDISVSFIRLAMNPGNGSNEVAAAYIDVTSTDARAMVWNGTAWTAHRNITTATSITTEDSIGVAYEQQRHGALTVAGTGTTADYAYWNGTSWNQTGNTDVNPSAAPTTNWITLKANPKGNHIMIMSLDGGSDLSTAQWLDGAWTGALRHDAAVDTNAQRPGDFAWEADGDVGLLVWGTTGGVLNYRTYSTASSWGAPNTIATGANTHTWVDIAMVPTGLATGTRALLGAQEATSTQIDGGAWDGATLTDIDAAFTTSVGLVTFQRFDISPERYPPRSSSSRNVTLNRTTDGTENIVGVTTTGGLSLITNATSAAMGNYSARGLSVPKGAAIRYSALIESMNPGVTWLTWEAYIVNASGETLLCAKGNRTRTASDVPVSGTDATAYTGACATTGSLVIRPDELLRVYLWANSSANNTITKRIDNSVTFAEVEGYPIGNLTARVVAPAADPLIGEGSNLTFACEIGCENGYCIDIRVAHEINDTPTTFSQTGYFDGNLVLNESAINPALLGNVNATTNATFNLTGNTYSANNTLRCDVTSEFQNVTSDLRNVSVMDNIGPNVTLIAPPDGGGFDPGNITFTINASDRRLGLCTLWTNTTGSWSTNQTVVPNNYTLTDFSTVNVSAYGTYVWNANCSDLSGNDTFAPANRTFVIAGDVYVNASEISFFPATPIEGENVTVAAVIRNRADRVETEVDVSFFMGDPEAGGVQIGENQTIATLPALGNATVNVSFIADIGTSEVFVTVDPPYGNGSIFESDETNNRASANATVVSWQTYYGNVSGNITLSTGQNATITTWFILNSTGNIYIADTDTMNGIGFASLRALGRNTSGGAPAGSVDDFEELDALLNGTNLTDGVNATYTINGAPIMLGAFTIQGVPLANVPLANSTADGNHTTGILWDADDSLDAVFDQGDAEDVVFVTLVEPNLTTVYGVADYAIRIPARIKSYRGTADTVTIYYELA